MNSIKRFLSQHVGESRPGELFRFGLSLGLVLLLWGCIFVAKGRGGQQYFLSGSAGLLCGAVFLPRILYPLYALIRLFLHFLNTLLTASVLLIVFYMILTPLAWGVRLAKKQFLDLRFKTDDTSYWIIREPQGISRDMYEKQF